MFITAVCVLFLIKLRWPRKKSLYDAVNLTCFLTARVSPRASHNVKSTRWRQWSKDQENLYVNGNFISNITSVILVIYFSYLFYLVCWMCCITLDYNFIYSSCSVIVRVSVVLKRTVGDSDWRFDNLSGRHLQSHCDIVPSVDGIYVSGYWPDWSIKLSCYWL